MGPENEKERKHMFATNRYPSSGQPVSVLISQATSSHRPSLLVPQLSVFLPATDTVIGSMTAWLVLCVCVFARRSRTGEETVIE